MDHSKYLRRVTSKKISDEIYEQIKDLILSGIFKPGDRLPPERELAEKLGVSRPVVREAINRLIAKGYVENIHGSGNYVLSITERSFEEGPIDDFLKRSEENLPFIVEVRKILETWSAAMSAVRAEDRDLEMIEEYLKEFEVAVTRGKDWYKIDANFHMSIAYATHNPLLIHLMDSIFHMIEKVTLKIEQKVHSDREKSLNLLNQHREIYEAIRSKNPELAYIKMMEHMLFIEREIAGRTGRRIPYPVPLSFKVP